MGLIRREGEVSLVGNNIKYYESLGYEIPRKENVNGKLQVPRGSKIKVKVEDLQEGSHTKVKCICDGCGEDLPPKSYKDYRIMLKNTGGTYCQKCATKLIASKNIKKTKLKKSKSFAQKLIEDYGDNALELYWDYEKNTIDPWKISYGSEVKVWIYCQEKDYHSSYEMMAKSFNKGQRCPYCHGTKIHPLDSIGQDIINKYGEEFLWSVWSDKNRVSPFEVAPNSNKRYWWKCLNGKHEDFQRSCNSSKKLEYRCPDCSKEIQKGENHPRWNPNLTDKEREMGRKYLDYYQWRTEVFERDNYNCQCCNKHGGKLASHHLNGYNWDKEHRTDIDNGITLCEECHKEFHKLYGKGNNTKEQFEEYLKNKKEGENK